jgi:hypothetical protein
MDEVTPPVLNPTYVSRYDGLHDAGRCHAEDTPEDNKPLRFSLTCGLKPTPKHKTVTFPVHCLSFLFHFKILVQFSGF